MARRTSRSTQDMFKGAMAAQETETITELKAQIEDLKSETEGVQLIKVSQIIPLKLPNNLKQPRLYFNSEKMKRLKDSIEKHGVLEPILLRPSSRDRFEIISGERRWRCSKGLGNKTIKAHVQEMDDSLALEAALIAHLLNEEISVIEQTESILSLMSLRLDMELDQLKSTLYATKNKQVRGMTTLTTLNHEELKTATEILEEFGMAFSSFVSNRMPMLNIRPEILDVVRSGRLSPTNAVLINRQPEEWQQTLLDNAEEMSKQELTTFIRDIKKNKEPAKTKEIPLEKAILNRFKVVSKNKSLLESTKVQTRLNKIQKLLDEIEALGN